MTSTPYMPLWIGDLLRDTSDLDTQELGAYILILCHLWVVGGQLRVADRGADGLLGEAAAAQLSRVARVSRRVWNRKIGPALQRFFRVSDDGVITQKRLLREVEKAAAVKGARKEASQARWSKSAQAKAPDPAPPPTNEAAKKETPKKKRVGFTYREHPPGMTEEVLLEFNAFFVFCKPSYRRDAMVEYLKLRRSGVSADELQEAARTMAAARPDPAYRPRASRWLQQGDWREPPAPIIGPDNRHVDRTAADRAAWVEEALSGCPAPDFPTTIDGDVLEVVQ